MAHRNCLLCGKPVILVPSAEERARKDCTGKPASHYKALFSMHAECLIERREAETKALISRLNKIPGVTAVHIPNPQG